MDVLLVDQRDVLGAAIIPVQHLHIIFLNLPGLFGNMLVGVGNYITEKLPPLRIGKLVVVQLFQLAAEVSNQFILGMQRQIGVALLAQQPDKLFFQFRLTLVAVRAHLGELIGGNNSIFTRACDNIERNHNIVLSLSKLLPKSVLIASTIFCIFSRIKGTFFFCSFS